MTTKRPKGKDAAQVASVVWNFGGRQYRMPLAEHEKTLLRQWHFMAASDDPELRSSGQKLLDEHAQRSAAATIAGLRKEALRPKQSAGGKASGKARAPAWHDKLVATARRMLEAGCDPRDLTGKLLQLDGFADRSRTTIDRALRKAGVK